MEAPSCLSTFETSVRKLRVYKAGLLVAAGEIMEISSSISLFLVYILLLAWGPVGSSLHFLKK